LIWSIWHRRSFVTNALGLSFVVAASAFAQQGAPQQPVPSVSQASGSQAGIYSLQVNSQMVVLDVVVTDKQGRIVTGLGKDDFHVFEDKAPQTILSLDQAESHLPPADLSIDSTAELDKLEPDVPVNIIVLDEVNTKFEDEAFARYSIKKYLNSQTDTLALPTMLVAVNLQRFMVLRDYTRSKKEILYALDHHLATLPWQAKTKSWVAEQFNASFLSLQEVAQATAGHPGHKNMIWIGRGFPPINPEYLTPQANDELKVAIENCTNLLRDARVTLYTVDPAGIEVTPPDQDENGFYEDDPFGGQVDFDAMATATGGKSFFGRNDVDKLIETSARDGASFYTLAYKPSTAIQDAKAFRNIRIAMKDPSLHAATREGYYAHPPAVPPALDANGKSSRQLVLDLSVAGESLMVYDAVPITLLRDPAAPDNFQIILKTSDIAWQAEDSNRLSAAISVFVESFDKKGKLLNRKGNINTVGLPASATPLLPAAPTLSMPVTLPTGPPAARLRFVVRVNSSGKIGAVNFFLVDPKTLADPGTGLMPGRK